MSLAASVALLLALVLSGASAALRDSAQAIGGSATDGFGPYILACLVFAAALFLLHEAVGLPLAVYRGYVLEHRFGLSREAFADWVRDHSKAAIIGLAFTIVATLAVYSAVYVTPRWWWLVAAGLATGAAILLTNILPTVLLPIFYKLEPLERAELRDRLLALARAGR